MYRKILVMGMVWGLATTGFANRLFEVNAVDADITLLFKGTIKPLKTTNVTTPAEGVVIDKEFEYGDTVKKGQTLVDLNSTKLETDFHSALSNYLSSKEKFYTSKNKLKGTEQLYKLGIISKDDLDAERTQVATSNMSFTQSLYNLEETIKTGQVLAEDIKSLEISDIKGVEEALKIKYNYLNVVASTDGVVLMAQSSRGGNEKLEVGATLKLGDVVAVIGDMSGVSINVQVNEVDVRRVKVGQPITVTGVAFPEHLLKGHVAHIDYQAGSKSGFRGGLPSFHVRLEVPHITDVQRSSIRVGMSCEVKLTIARKGALEIPIDAVFRKGGQSLVRVNKGGQVEEVAVETGTTTIDSVEITKGLAVGDKVVVPDTATRD